MADDDEFFRPEDELSRYATYGGGAVVHSAAQATAAAAATAQTTTTGHLSSLMLAASDDLEIPLINVRTDYFESIDSLHLEQSHNSIWNKKAVEKCSVTSSRSLNLIVSRGCKCLVWTSCGNGIVGERN